MASELSSSRPEDRVWHHIKRIIPIHCYPPTSVLWKEGGEAALLQQARWVVLGLEGVHLPVVDPLMVPRLVAAVLGRVTVGVWGWGWAVGAGVGERERERRGNRVRRQGCPWA